MRIVGEYPANHKGGYRLYYCQDNPFSIDTDKTVKNLEDLIRIVTEVPEHFHKRINKSIQSVFIRQHDPNLLEMTCKSLLFDRYLNAAACFWFVMPVEG